jgi:hypothetical protein
MVINDLASAMALVCRLFFSLLLLFVGGIATTAAKLLLLLVVLLLSSLGRSLLCNGNGKELQPACPSPQGRSAGDSGRSVLIEGT